MRKPGLSRRTLVTIRGTEDDLHLQVFDAGASLGTSVVGGSIHEDDYVSAPVLAELLGEDLREPREKHLHDAFVGVTLSEREPDEALSGDSYDHVDSMPKSALGHGIVAALQAPAATPEVTPWNPSLVDVDDVAALAIDLEHLLSVEAAEDLVALGVAPKSDSLDAAVAESILRLHGFDDHLTTDLKTSALQSLHDNLLGGPDGVLGDDGAIEDGDDCSLLLGTLQFGTPLLDEDAPLFHDALLKITNELELHLKAVGDFLLGSTTLNSGFSNLKPLLSTQLVQLASLKPRMDRVRLFEEVLSLDFDEKTATSDAGIN